jgi:hypothetical protein
MTLFGSRLKPILDEKASSLRNGVERGLREDSVKAVTAVRGDRGRHSRRGPGFLVVQSRETEKGQQFPGFLPDMAIQGILSRVIFGFSAYRYLYLPSASCDTRFEAPISVW